MVICTQLIIILRIDRTLLTLLLIHEVMTSDCLSHMLIGKFLFYIRTVLKRNSLTGDIISAHNSKLFNKHPSDTR